MILVAIGQVGSPLAEATSVALKSKTTRVILAHEVSDALGGSPNFGDFITEARACHADGGPNVLDLFNRATSVPWNRDPDFLPVCAMKLLLDGIMEDDDHGDVAPPPAAGGAVQEQQAGAAEKKGKQDAAAGGGPAAAATAPAGSPQQIVPAPPPGAPPSFRRPQGAGGAVAGAKEAAAGAGGEDSSSGGHDGDTQANLLLAERERVLSSREQVCAGRCASSRASASRARSFSATRTLMISPGRRCFGKGRNY